MIFWDVIPNWIIIKGELRSLEKTDLAVAVIICIARLSDRPHIDRGHL